MHYHRKPPFALLLCSFQAYLKAILRNETNTALVFSFPSSEWMQEGMQNYLELGPCQEHFLGLSVRGYASENTFQISTAWNPVLQRFASSTFRCPSIHKLSPQATSRRQFWASLCSKHTWEGCRRPDWMSRWQQEKNPCASQQSWVYCMWTNGWCKRSCFWAPLLQSDDSRGQLHITFWSFFLPVRGKISVC